MGYSLIKSENFHFSAFITFAGSLCHEGGRGALMCHDARTKMKERMPSFKIVSVFS